MDRRRAGNPGREGYSVGPVPRGRIISDSDSGAPNYDNAPRTSLHGLDGLTTGRGRAAIPMEGDEGSFPNMRNSERWPEQPGPTTVRRLKKGGKVTAPKKKAATKGKSLRRK